MMVMSDGGVRWLVFNQKATVNTIQPSNTHLSNHSSNIYSWLLTIALKCTAVIFQSLESQFTKILTFLTSR